MRIPEFIRYDLGLKIAALALALFVWVTVAERRQVEVVANLPLKYTNIPTDMIFASEVPKAARAKIRGRGKFLRWRLADVYFAIDLSPAGEGMVTHVVSPGEVVVPPDKDLEVLEVLEPKAVRVELDKLVTRRLPVRPLTRGEIPDDKVMLGKPNAEPEEIVVAGAEGLIESLGSVSTESVDLGQLARKGRVEAEVDLGGLPYVTSDVTEVVVSARVEPRKELGIPMVPLVPITAGGVRARFTPDSLDVTIIGAESHVDSLDPTQVRLLVNVTGLPKGQLIFRPMIREGALYFEVMTAGRSEEDGQIFEIKGRAEAPYDVELVSVLPEEIGFVQR
jgi:hypothetical protein